MNNLFIMVFANLRILSGWFQIIANLIPIQTFIMIKSGNKHTLKKHVVAYN